MRLCRHRVNRAFLSVLKSRWNIKELEELINRTLEKLPERRRCIFKMHRMEGKKYAEIASLLTVSVKTVEAEMTKALKTLRKEVEKYIE